MKTDRRFRAAVVDGSADGSCSDAADALASTTELSRAEPDTAGFDAYLVVTPDRVALRSATRSPRTEVWADFILGGPCQRRRFVGSAKGPLARAIGVRGRCRHVFDATAGLGQDAFRLAMLGCKVTAVERSAIPAALLLNGIERARRVPELRKVFDARFRLLAGDSRDILRELFLNSPPDVVYLDPMFPPNRKSSPAVREEMRLLRAVVGDDPDADDLFRAAVDVAGERVVVKRLLHAAPLCEKPDYCIKGNIARYDVYLTNLESPAG